VKRVVSVFPIILLLLVATAGAQQQSLPYVDIDAANEEIASLRENSTERSGQNDELTQRNTRLSSQITGDQQTLVEIDPILGRVESELTELYAVNRTIVDEQMKERSQAAIGRARTIRSNLQGQVEQLNSQIAESRKEIDANWERIRINRRRMGENEERILFLEAAIRQTEAQRQRLDGFITNVDAILSDAERYIRSTDD
jgi:chromosome segregation ATPase